MDLLERIKDRLSKTSQRSNLIIKNVLIGIGIRGVNVIVSLMLVPMTINYVSSELYGIWLTLASMTHWLGFFDIGLGNGLRNNLAKAIALGHPKLGRIYVSSTYFVIGIIFSVIGVLLFFSAPLINWSSILSVSTGLNGILIDVVRIMACSFCLQVVLRIIANVAQAYQLNALSSAFDSAGNLLSLILIFILTKTTFPDLRYLALVFCLTPICVNIIASFLLYNTKFKDVSPSPRQISTKSMKSITNLGALFFLIQIVYIILFQATNFIIANICGPNQVTVYNVAYKYLSIAIMLLQIVLAPMWSAFTDAYAKNDYHWMRNIYSKLMKVWGMTAILAILFVSVSPWVYKLWVKDSVSIPFGISVFVGIYVVLSSFTNIHSIIINGIGTIRLQLFQSIVQVVIYIPLAYVAGHLWGLVGVLVALCVTMLLPSVLLFIQTKLLLNKKAYGIWLK